MKLIILYLLLLSLSSAGALNASSKRLTVLGEVGDFSLIERNGKTFSKNDLAGHVWISNFIFTQCLGPCPILSEKMSELQNKVPEGTKLVSFSVDPETDSPQVLSEYAARFNARENRWFFLTGNKERLGLLFRNSFHIGVMEDPYEKNPVNRLIHSTYFVLTDQDGKIRGYYEGTDSTELKKLVSDAKILTIEKENPQIIRLPLINACLNGGAAFLLLMGYHAIRRKKILIHKLCMASAFLCSIVFLSGYLLYHYYVGSVPFTGTGWTRKIYFSILISHTILAGTIAPLAVSVLYQAWRENFQKHKQIARWALPIWLYVSITGVTIYWMLYT